MTYKKQLCLLIGLLCLSLCVFLGGCVDTGDGGDGEKPAETTVPEQEAAQPGDSIPEETQPDVTQTAEPEATEPEITEPEATEPEVTEPEVTQPSNTKPGVNNGTGGGYNPGSGNTTEPEAPAESEIVPPAPGSRENAYYEYISDPTGSFETVKIPAGETVFYRIKTPGSFLCVADEDLTVTYDLQVRKNADVVLPGDDTQVVTVQFTNNGAVEKAFAVEIKDAAGSQTNPIALDSLKNAELLSNAYYIWTADKAGLLRLTATENITLLLNGEDTQSATEISLSQQDELVIFFAGEEGQTAVINGYVAVTVELAVTEIPGTVETAEIPAGESVIYRITGAEGRLLTVTNENILLLYEDTVYTPDETGTVTFALNREGAALVEVYNGSPEVCVYTLNFSYAPGHEQNPMVLTELGEIPVETWQNEDGFFVTYTAESAGIATFQMWMYPEREDVTCNIAVRNEQTDEYAVLIDWDDQGNKLEAYTAAVQAKAGDVISVKVTAVDGSNEAVDASFSIYSTLYGTEDQPISVQHPGFEAWVPAGVTMYYEGYNLSGLPMTLKGTDVEVIYGGVTYTPVDGEIKLTITEGPGTPAKIGITNQSQEDVIYQVSLEYPLGHMENPDTLKRGNNTLTQIAGGEDYYFVFESPRSGKLALTFNAGGNWVYAVDNVTQSVYGDTLFSDDDPQVSQTIIEVDVGDIILVRVNTYDPENPYETPEGTVTFKADYVR